MVSDEYTLKQISDLPFITAPPLKIRVRKIERVCDIAKRNGIHWRKCYEILHSLDRDPSFELRWFQTHAGTESVCISINPRLLNLIESG